MNPSGDLVARLWRLCAVLRKDGITYPQYVAELTYLLFLKMMKETAAEEGRVPPGLRWADLEVADAPTKLDFYRSLLQGLGEESRGVDAAIARIFAGASTVLRDAKNLDMLIEAIGRIDWFAEGQDSFGDLYEGLLQKNAEETKRGAGQYFTPRPVIEVMVALTRPNSGDIVQDPAAGTGGFLVAAHHYIRDQGGTRSEKSPVFTGIENVRDTFRLLLMNLYLHGIDAACVHLGDTLSNDHERLSAPTLILTNPPFGPAGGRPSRSDLSITATVANYQLPFVEHCIRSLGDGGRAAIIVPDNVLFDDGRGRALREMMLASCNVHTLLRLPPGIFYAQGVKTNILFLTKTTAGTENLWVYDLRSNAPTFGRSKPLTRAYFDDFVRAFGERVDGCGQRTDEGVTGRFRCFTRTALRERNDNLDIGWLRDEIEDPDANLVEPEDLAAAISAHLRSALTELESIAEEVEFDAVSELVDGS
jgi:type I restriction enzyme M protein